MAGWTPLALINAPAAAALALAEQRGYLDASGNPSPCRMLIYDLGGAGFDVALCEISSQGLHVLASDGEPRLGGRDWDERLRDHLAQAFVERHGVDPRRDLLGLARLNRAVEDAKHTLGTRDVAETHLDSGGHALDHAIHRGQFEELTADLVERTAFGVRNTLSQAGLGWQDIHEIALVGGATRMPMIAAMLRAASRLEPRWAANHEELVARGAAIHASNLLRARASELGRIGPNERPPFTVIDHATQSVGIEQPAPGGGRGRNKVVIARGATLPALGEETLLVAAPNPRSMSLRFLQGEGFQAEACSSMAEATLTGFPRGLAGCAGCGIALARRERAADGFGKTGKRRHARCRPRGTT